MREEDSMKNSIKNIKQYFPYLALFCLLLISANVYLFRDGFWFYQDAGYWPKNTQEAVKMLLVQFHSFTNDGFYLGNDRGLFGFTRILTALYTTVMFFLFGYEGSQIAFALTGFTLTFATFYLFSGIFFQDKKVRYFLSLLYTFNPLTYSMQGHAFYLAISPLFIYAFYKYFFESRKVLFSYLLLSITAAFLWVSYIRFIQSNALIIIPYIIYLFSVYKKQVTGKKICVFIVSYLLVFSPIIYSFAAQILDRSQTAFNYGNVLGKFAVQYHMVTAFNLIQSMAPKVYGNPLWIILGVLFFGVIIYLILTFPKREQSLFYLVNLVLMIVGITLYSLVNIFGKDGYLLAIKIFPFIINEPFWALYVSGLPIIVLLGLLTNSRKVYLYVYTLLFISLALIPFLSLGDFQLQKFSISSLPKPYTDYFVKPFYGIPEGSYYYPGTCWRASYMDKADTPTLCPNLGYQYPPILFDDPRLVSGKAYELSQHAAEKTFVDNYRITHNLKHIFVARDLVVKKGPGPETDREDIQSIEQITEQLNANSLLVSKKNENFTEYTYRNGDTYDYFIYSPDSIMQTSTEEFYSRSLSDRKKPVVVEKSSSLLNQATQSAEIFYKIAPDNPTIYYMKIIHFDSSKPFIIQFNQAFGNSWVLKEISEQDFDSKPCITDNDIFVYTQNERCIYKAGLFADIDSNTNNLLGKNTHFLGNYLSNGWIVQPEELSHKAKESGTLYAAIAYTKQTYFSYTILVATITVAVLIVVTILQLLSKIIRKEAI